jgi:hypothetical protein
VTKLKELIVILDLYEEGLTISVIAERTGLDRKTVRKYIERGIEPPLYGPRQPRACIIEPYQTYVRERLSAYPELSIARLLREIWGLKPSDLGQTRIGGGPYSEIRARLRRFDLGARSTNQHQQLKLVRVPVSRPRCPG